MIIAKCVKWLFFAFFVRVDWLCVVKGFLCKQVFVVFLGLRWKHNNKAAQQMLPGADLYTGQGKVGKEQKHELISFAACSMCFNLCVCKGRGSVYRSAQCTDFLLDGLFHLSPHPHQLSFSGSLVFAVWGATTCPTTRGQPCACFAFFFFSFFCIGEY